MVILYMVVFLSVVDFSSDRIQSNETNVMAINVLEVMHHPGCLTSLAIVSS